MIRLLIVILYYLAFMGILTGCVVIGWTIKDFKEKKRNEKDIKEFQVGDYITCADIDDMLDVMHQLAFIGIETEFANYETMEGKKIYRLEITEVNK